MISNKIQSIYDSALDSVKINGVNLIYARVILGFSIIFQSFSLWGKELFYVRNNLFPIELLTDFKSYWHSSIFFELGSALPFKVALILTVISGIFIVLGRFISAGSFITYFIFLNIYHSNRLVSSAFEEAQLTTLLLAGIVFLFYKTHNVGREVFLSFYGTKKSKFFINIVVLIQAYIVVQLTFLLKDDRVWIGASKGLFYFLANEQNVRFLFPLELLSRIGLLNNSLIFFERLFLVSAPLMIIFPSQFKYIRALGSLILLSLGSLFLLSNESWSYGFLYIFYSLLLSPFSLTIFKVKEMALTFRKRKVLPVLLTALSFILLSINWSLYKSRKPHSATLKEISRFIGNNQHWGEGLTKPSNKSFSVKVLSNSGETLNHQMLEDHKDPSSVKVEWFQLLRAETIGPMFYENYLQNTCRINNYFKPVYMEVYSDFLLPDGQRTKLFKSLSFGYDCSKLTK